MIHLPKILKGYDMFTKTYTFSIDISQTNIAYSNLLFMDIETTGFSRDSTILYLIGCGYYEKNHFHIIQWLNDDGVSESSLLLTFRDFLLEKKPTLFTFNGESFDIPYLNRHYELHNIPFQISMEHSFDLYKKMKPFQSLFSMKHGKQKDWESFLDIRRKDPYNGGQLISIYKQYLLKKEPSLLDFLLLHNKEDLLGMQALLPLTAYSSLLEGKLTFQNMESSYREDFPASSSIQITCSLEQKLPHSIEIAPLFLEKNTIPGAMYASEKQMHLWFPLENGPLKYFYSDYQNYFYLPEEDRAVHKTIGCYVDRKFRKKATPSTCYIKKKGIFVPIFFHKTYKGIQTETKKYKDFLVFYKKEYSDSYSYIDLHQLLEEKKEILPHYLCDWMKEIFMAKIKESAKTSYKK